MVNSNVVEQFVEGLQDELRARGVSLLDAEFLGGIEAGAVTRDAIGEWARVFYAATRNGRVSLGNFYANSPDDPDLRRELAENIFEEETGRLSGVRKGHMDVFCDFLSAFNVMPEEAHRLTSPADDYQPQGAAIPPDDFFVQLCAYGFSVEVPNAEFCARAFAALLAYGFSEQQLRWFSMHATLDAEHGREFQKYVTRAADHESGFGRVRDATLEMSAVTKEVWNGFGAWR
jgi:pyrroloquinoline-quinone synthase